MEATPKCLNRPGNAFEAAIASRFPIRSRPLGLAPVLKNEVAGDKGEFNPQFPRRSSGLELRLFVEYCGKLIQVLQSIPAGMQRW
jgi:hypothetical protein